MRGRHRTTLPGTRLSTGVLVVLASAVLLVAAAVSVNFPVSGGRSTESSVTVPITLAPGRHTLTFANDRTWAPDLDRIRLVDPA